VRGKLKKATTPTLRHDMTRPTADHHAESRRPGIPGHRRTAQSRLAARPSRHSCAFGRGQPAPGDRVHTDHQERGPTGSIGSVGAAL